MIPQRLIDQARVELDKEIPPVFIETIDYDTVEGEEAQELLATMRSNYPRWSRDRQTFESLGGHARRLAYVEAFARQLGLPYESNEAHSMIRIIVNKEKNHGFTVRDRDIGGEDRVQVEDWFLRQCEKWRLV